MRSLPDYLLIGPYRLDCRKRWLTLPSGSKPNVHQELTNAPFSLLEKLIRASPEATAASDKDIYALREKLRALEPEGCGPDPKKTILEVEGQYCIPEVWELIAADTSYGDRLLRAFSLQLLKPGTKPTPHLPWRPELQPASIVFASEKAVIGPDGGRRLLMPQESRRADETDTEDELTGDGVALHEISVQLTRLDVKSTAVPSGNCKQAFENSQPTFLIGGPYSNEYLAELEETELASAAKPFGARFDMRAQLERRQLKVTLYDGSPTPPFGKNDITRVGYPHPEYEYAVIRRWLSLHNTDTILIAGLTAQGTLAAARFLCNREGMKALFDKLHAKGVKDEAWEWTQWDALLEIKLKDRRADRDHSQITVKAAEPR